MPNQDMPVDENDEVNSSLSLSSNENGSVSNQSVASSISNGLNNDSLRLPRSRQVYSPLAAHLQPMFSEPTLDAVLVISFIYF